MIPPIAFKLLNLYLPSVVKNIPLKSNQPNPLMKPPIRLAVAALACLVDLAHAKTITVDNRVGSVAMYSNLQTAIDAAETGDTILIAGSPTGYGAAYLTKRLRLVGPGYYLSENQIAGVTKDHAYVGIISLGAINSDTFKSSASGTELSGLFLDAVQSGSFGYNGRSYGGPVNVEIGNCRIGSLGKDSTWGYDQIYYSARRSWIGSAWPRSSSLRNCMITSGILVYAGSTVEHCILPAAGTSSQAESSISNSIFVASGSGPGAAGFANNCKGSVDYCMAVGGLSIAGTTTFLKAGVGNHPTITYLEDVFIYSNPVDRQYLLKPTSPARGIGLNGVDMGMFGGASPYVISGVPAMPRITHFATPAAATSSSGLRFEVKAKSF